MKKDSSSDLVEAGEMVRRGSSAADMVEQSHPPSSRRGKSNTGTFPTNSVTTTIAGRKSRIITRSEGSEDKIMVTTAAIPVGTAMEVSEGDSSDDVLGADDDYDSASVTSDQLDNIKAETGSGKFRSTSFGDSTAGVTSRENQSIPNKKMSSTNVFSMGIPSSQLSSSQVPGMGSSSGQVKDKILAAKEKNREHAKNTRLRKKNYIESLKKSIKELSDEREKTERDKKQSMNKIMEQVRSHKLYFDSYRVK